LLIGTIVAQVGTEVTERIARYAYGRWVARGTHTFSEIFTRAYLSPHAEVPQVSTRYLEAFVVSYIRNLTYRFMSRDAKCILQALNFRTSLSLSLGQSDMKNTLELKHITMPRCSDNRTALGAGNC